ncbi:MAG: tRNA preQ1(34) S-adenosylmethionine ribosyltransferase-isomerase QueA [Candidatus Omnitrophota bacterium]|jgi:S-adenosylmethionine:tRNA ribosyltransferase-isomerase
MQRLSDFDFELPPELVAQYPLRARDNARLLVLERKSGRVEHRLFSDLPDYMDKEDLLVLNDSRVVPARVNARRKSGGRAEIFLLERREGLIFRALLKPARLRMGEQLILSDSSIVCTITGKDEVSFSGCKMEDIYAAGSVPLPPYIKREPSEEDRLYYQTVFAREDGSVAAPTAGLHFTPQLLEKVSAAGAQLAYITLHIGYGTFKPVKCEDITRHNMEEESFWIGEDAALRIKEAAAAGKNICAVGTTSMRTLETYASGAAKEGKTGIFIYPGYNFRLVSRLVTNFHLPKTTLLMLVCAFAGTQMALDAYRQAVERKYRFYSYGDAMLII